MAEKTVSVEEMQRQLVFVEQIRSLNDHNYFDTGRRRTFYVQTYGCQQNFSDSEKLKGMLAEMGYEEAAGTPDADIVLFNTCAVREHAEQRVLGNTGALKPLKARRPSMIIGLCGCMMQQEHIAKKIRASYPHVDLVFGTGALHRLPELLSGVMAGRRVFDLSESGEIPEGLPQVRDGSVKAWLPVSYGCNNFCTYCVVPYVRGRERSRDPGTVLAEARELVARGFKELTLLGQNVNSYGTDLGGSPGFARLLRQINDIPGDFRIRFMTSHPKDATRELFEAVAECDKICKHIHLPFQAGSDRILKLMNRRYTRGDYLALTELARRIIPGVSLTSDVIVGFPGETYEEFQETLDLVRRIEFDNLYTFIYSKRRSTPAESMPDDTPREEKSKRFDELIALQDAVTAKRLKALEGRTLRVLCEGPGKTGGGYMTGRTDAGIIVDFKAQPQTVGAFLPIQITHAQRFMLQGETVKE